MNGSWRAAWTVSVCAGVVLAAGLVLVPGLASVPMGLVLVGITATVAWLAAALTIGRFAPGNLVGPLAAAVGLTMAVTISRELLWQSLAERPASAAEMTWLMALLRESAVWLFVGLALVLLVFPNGRLPSRRWRAVPPVLLVAAGAHHAWGMVDPTPFRPPLEAFTSPFAAPGMVIEAVSVVGFVLLVATLAAAAVAPFARSRVAGPQRRAQLRWLAIAGLGVPGFLLVCLAEILVSGEPGWLSAAIGVVTLVGLPVAISIAVLWTDLFDVDRVLASAVTYGLLSVMLGAVFMAVAVSGGLVLGGDSVVAAVGATAVTAVAVSPVRSRLRRLVGRRVYPLRDAVLASVTDLQRRVHDGRAQPEELQAVLREVLRDPDLRVGYRSPSSASYLDSDGQVVDLVGAVPVRLAGEPIGVLVPGTGHAHAELLRSVAGAAAVIVEVVRLRQELTTALTQVEHSRTRILRAGDAERRRLERDLHDGSQQRLVSLGMALRVAQRQLSSGTVDIGALLDQTVAELGTAVAELRQLAHGLRPSSLDDGLHPALVSLAHRLPVPVVVEVTDQPLPEPIATTLYFVASEAIANAVKHADASQIDVRVARHGARVQLRVTDNGRGGAQHVVHVHNGDNGAGPPAGSGLLGISDRVDAAGGHLRVESPAGAGTLIEVELPCGS